ncbi:hypothetical protein CSA37_09725 [Candidatus Fermentibacteria bacterium]|nr:MAG: hypothetical protein CSA37_09725 [Candidatus Fermentibacteria bacterium]
MIGIIIFVLLSQLPCYSLSADPQELEYLREHPHQGIEIPAILHLESMDIPCTLALRGGTSQGCSKKSWHISLEDGGHILLNAQFRDPSLIRNTLGLYMTRALGFPAPLTEFVTLEFNGFSEGVYEHVERVDRLFYARNGTGFGALYKNVDTAGRLVCQYADTCGTAGLEPKIDSQPYACRILELIESCRRGDVSSLNENEILAAMAVNTAIWDRDGLIKNCYFHQYAGQWHFYPWDRDATFGNSWQGFYDSTWTTQSGLHDIGYFGASRAFLENPESVIALDEYIDQCASLMDGELPAMVDSFNMLLRNELCYDPYYEYTPVQFDSLCLVLKTDLLERAAYLRTLNLGSSSPVPVSWSISNCMDMENELHIELELAGPEPETVFILVSINGNYEIWHYMHKSNRNSCWEYDFEVADTTHFVNFVFGPRLSSLPFPIFFPSWAMRGYDSRPSPCPGARAALAPLEPAYFIIHEPVWCGENLWVLPVTNENSSQQDISHCSFLLGEPSGSIFFSDSVLISSGETFYLTSNAAQASSFYGGRVFGDAGTSFPSGSQLILQDPSWNYLHSWHITGADSLPPGEADIIPCEISAGAGEDWIELYNRGSGEADLSSWYFMDSSKNVSIIPEGTRIAPGQLYTAWENPPGQTFNQLDFSLNGLEDTLSLFNSTGTEIFKLGWSESWPLNSTGIMYLISPLHDYNLAAHWQAEDTPGTPGESNPGWKGIFSSVEVNLSSQNPSNGAFSFTYTSSSTPIEAILYDMSGRRIAGLPLPGTLTGTVSADFSGTIPSGIYIIYLRTAAGADTACLTVLNEI